jgi:succinate dehydrogenase / fumarate reductase iron-sulfur subunit
MEHYSMNLTPKCGVKKMKSTGGFEVFQVSNISSEMSFLEMFDVLNEKLIRKRPHCIRSRLQEGICGTCSMYINGRPWAMAR